MSVPFGERDLERSRIWLSLFVGLLGLFLLLRYSPLIHALGIDIDKLPGSIASGWTFPVLLVASFLGISLFTIHSGRSVILTEHLNRSRTTLGLFISLLGVLLLIVLSIGKLSYSTYTDEKRDTVVDDLVARQSLEIYVTGRNEELLTDSLEIKMLAWARNLHPPGHYVPALFVSARPHSVAFFRFLYMLPLVLAFIVAFYWSSSRIESLRMFALIVTLLFASSFLRNYTFIRVGDELFPFLGFSGLLTTLYMMVEKRWRISAGTVAAGFFFFAIAFFAKFSSVVAMFAATGALIAGAVVYRDRHLGKIALVCLGVLVAGLLVYYLTFRNTLMFDEQLVEYQDRILRALHLISTEQMTRRGQPTKSIWHFVQLIPFHYGPVMSLLGIWFLGSVAARRYRPNRIDILTILFLLIGFAGVLAVNPRAQYTAPLMLGLVFVVSRFIRKSIPPEVGMKIVLVAMAFATAEVLLISGS